MSVHCFSVHAEAEPGTLPRVLEVVALTGHVPDRLHCQLDGPDATELVLDIQVAGLSPEDVTSLTRRLSRVLAVTRVLTAEKAMG